MQVSILSRRKLILTFTLAAAQKGKRAVLIGTSFISMELAVAMGKRELASIDVIGMEEVPFETILGKKVGQALMKVRLLLSNRHFQLMALTQVPRVSRYQVPHASQGRKDRDK